MFAARKRLAPWELVMLLPLLAGACGSLSKGSTQNDGDTMVAENSCETLRFYATQSIVTDPGRHACLYEGLPHDIPGLCAVAQGLTLHIYLAPRYDVTPSDERRQEEANLRTVEKRLTRALALDDAPITVARPPAERVVGTCRDYAVLLCSFLRYQGVPARVRNGFDTYFTPGFMGDHWICEYWHRDEGRWVQVDVQVDDVQKGLFAIDFDPADLPTGKFLYAGEAYLKALAGEIDANRCGIGELRGLWFVRGNVIRDLMALNKLEVLPWDSNALMGSENTELEPLIKDVARMTADRMLPLDDLRAVYEGHSEFRMPPDWQP